MKDCQCSDGLQPSEKILGPETTGRRVLPLYTHAQELDRPLSLPPANTRPYSNHIITLKPSVKPTSILAPRTVSGRMLNVRNSSRIRIKVNILTYLHTFPDIYMHTYVHTYKYAYPLPFPVPLPFNTPFEHPQKPNHQHIPSLSPPLFSRVCIPTPRRCSSLSAKHTARLRRSAVTNQRRGDRENVCTMGVSCRDYGLEGGGDTWCAEGDIFTRRSNTAKAAPRKEKMSVVFNVRRQNEARGVRRVGVYRLNNFLEVGSYIIPSYHFSNHSKMSHHQAALAGTNHVSLSATSNRHAYQLANQLRRPLRRDHNAELRIDSQRLHNGRIDHVQISHADDRRIHINARPQPTRARPMIDLSIRIRRRRRDVREDLRLGRGGGDIQGREVRLGQRGEDIVDEGRDVLRVLGVAEVDALGARDEIGVEDDFAGGLEARGAVDVERDGVVVGVAVVAGGADGALHAGFRAVRVRDVVPEDADFGGEGVRARAAV